MNPLEKIVKIEITADQACGIQAALILAKANCQKWLDEHQDSKGKGRADTEMELEKLKETSAIIGSAIETAMEAMSNEGILKRLEAAEQSARKSKENCEEIGAIQSAKELGAVIDKIQELKKTIKAEQEAQ